MHFLSGYSDCVRSGIVIGFFLRAFIICCEEFAEEEMTIYMILSRKYGIHSTKNKAEKSKWEPVTRREDESKNKSNDVHLY